MKEIGMLFSTDMVRAILEGKKICTRRLIKNNPNKIKWGLSGWENERGKTIRQPYDVGDKIYVRETYALECHIPDPFELIYKADGNNNLITKWEPSLFMPKKYARIWLEVTSVSIEKVSDITEKESLKEGFSSKKAFDIYWKSHYNEFDKYVWVIQFRRIDNDERGSEK